MNSLSRVPKSARQLVLGVLKSSESPLTIHELYKRVVQAGASSSTTTAAAAETAVPDSGPHPGSTIRSMSYLKQRVLPVLTQMNLAEQVHTLRELTPEQVQERLKMLSKGKKKAPAPSAGAGSGASALPTTASVWLWRPKAPEAAAAAAARAAKKEKERVIYGSEVGYGEDVSHLNKRRQRARAEKVRADVQWMRALEREKREGLREAAKAAKAAKAAAKVAAASASS